MQYYTFCLHFFMISTFSTEMPGFLHKQASDESSCIDFLYISGLPDSKNDRGITSSAAFILYSSCIQNFLESCNFLCCILKDQSCIACVCNTVTVYICCCRCICIQFCQFCTCCQKCGTVGCCHCTIVVYVT